MYEEQIAHKVPPELIAEFERPRTVVRVDLSEIEEAQEPSGPVEEAEWYLLESDLDREMWADLASMATFELRQPKGTQMLYVVDVSDDGKTVRFRSSDGSYGVTVGRPPD